MAVSSNISDLFTPTKDAHHFNTCSSTTANFSINYCQLNHHKNSFPIMGANICDSIPQAMRQLQKYRFKNNNNWIFFSNLLKTGYLSWYIHKWNEKNLKCLLFLFMHVALLAFTYIQLLYPSSSLCRWIALCSLKCMPVLAEYHVINFRQIHWLRGKIPLTFCWEQKAAFLSVGSINVVVLLPLREIDNYFGRNV